jgi:acyl-CoA thioester hydrolase
MYLYGDKKSILSPKYSLMIETQTNIRVRYAETDKMNIVYHGNYAQYFEVARAECIRSFGFTYKQIEELGIMMPIVDLQIKFLRPAHYDDLLTVKAILRELPTTHKIEFHHEVYNEEGKLLTVGKVVLFLVDAITKERTTMPQQMLDQFKHKFKTFTHQNPSFVNPSI